MEINLDCPVCEEKKSLTMEMDHEPDDHNYGADRDGNRGVFRAGTFYVDGDIVCDNGCEFSPDQLASICKEAVDEAERQARLAREVHENERIERRFYRYDR